MHHINNPVDVFWADETRGGNSYPSFILKTLKTATRYHSDIVPENGISSFPNDTLGKERIHKSLSLHNLFLTLGNTLGTVKSSLQSIELNKISLTWKINAKILKQSETSPVPTRKRRWI